MKERKFRQLVWEDRIRLESYLKANLPKEEIATLLKCSRATIYNELKRGAYEHLNSDYTTEIRYSPEIAQEHYEQHLLVRGAKMKIDKDYKFAEYLEKKIADEKYSPEAVLGEIKAQNREDEFDTTICVRTLYNYIDKGVFFRLTNDDLPVKRNKGKRDYKHVHRRKKVAAGEIIENRPKEIDDRGDFGNWEMDTVVGAQGKSKHSLLVLTERMTRKEILFLLYHHTTKEVVDRIDQLERRYGKNFSKIFKTITVDNGTEFADYEGMRKSVDGVGPPRTQIYYCHPYSSWERGTNETTNKLVRRHIPKGVNFDDKTEADIQNIEDWINQYPRRIFGYHTADEMFEKELAKII